MSELRKLSESKAIVIRHLDTLSGRSDNSANELRDECHALLLVIEQQETDMGRALSTAQSLRNHPNASSYLHEIDNLIRMIGV